MVDYEIEFSSYTVRFIPEIGSPRTINMYLGLLKEKDEHVHNKHNLGASPPLVSRVSSG